MIDRTMRSYCLIDCDALRHNVQTIKSKLASGEKLMCVVKANAYGHGAVEVAKVCEDAADYFGVATDDEGVELRENGIFLPILILGNTPPCDYQKLIDYDLQATVFSIQSAMLLNSFCKEKNVKAKVHIAVDSGMGRIGFLPDEKDLARQVFCLKNLSVEGIFTHFACADEEGNNYSELQKERFDDFLDYLKNSNIDIPLVHACNSAGILYGKGQYSMSRAGIALYGLDPSSSVGGSLPLKPALSWHTSVAHIKKLKKGEGVSYGRTYVAKEERIIATLPIGYADGYPRVLSSKFHVLIKGKRAPIVGRICMDQMMVDVSDIDGVSLYDDVILIGEQDGERISAEQIAKRADTINYEIVCSISQRVKRIYLR
ncbi:MAG: alanine racemase [Clostridiales bacterium]|nr:alanine racemase [Clostridiales bacterium]